MSDAQKARSLKASFIARDINGDGRLSYAEFVGFLRSGVTKLHGNRRNLARLSAAEMQHLFKMVDTDESGHIEFNELVDFLYPSGFSSSGGGRSPEADASPSASSSCAPRRCSEPRSRASPGPGRPKAEAQVRVEAPKEALDLSVLRELRSLADPVPRLEKLFEAVTYLLEEPYTGPTGTRKLLSERDVLKRLHGVKGRISEGSISSESMSKALGVRDELGCEFSEATMRHTCAAAGILCAWVCEVLYAYEASLKEPWKFKRLQLWQHRQARGLKTKHVFAAPSPDASVVGSLQAVEAFWVCKEVKISETVCMLRLFDGRGWVVACPKCFRIESSGLMRCFEILERGSVRLVKASWLVSQPDNYVVQRQQELPPEAFLDSDLSAQLFLVKHGIVVISYSWLSMQHPDPTGFHFSTVRRFMLKYRSDFKDTFCDNGVFWDFLSMPQVGPGGQKRSDEEMADFSEGLGIINYLYGSDKTTVTMLTTMPISGEGLNLTPYFDRGWCIFEATVSAIAKDTDMLLDLGAAAKELWDSASKLNRVRAAGFGRRMPPTEPMEMQMLLEAATFTNRADTSVVIRKYQDFFEQTALNAQNLTFGNESREDGWGLPEVEKLARALPAFQNLNVLCLSGHEALRDGALQELAEALPKLPNLKELWLDGCGFGHSSLAVLRGCLPKTMALEFVCLPKDLKATADGYQFEEACTSGAELAKGQKVKVAWL